MATARRIVCCALWATICQASRVHRVDECEEVVPGSQKRFGFGRNCQCPGETVIVGTNWACVGSNGFEQRFNSKDLEGKGCRCEEKLSTVGQGDDGNPWGWDRYRRCDDTEYSPPCGLCEGVGGTCDADEKTRITLASCEVVATKAEIDLSTLKEPIWGADFTVTRSAEILIGRKDDAACFQSFPSNDSITPMCYKPQEVKISSDMLRAKALRLDVNQAGNAWGLVGNVSSVILHQYGNMWIMNRLPLGITQTICAAPREGFDAAKPAVAPLQFNWTKNMRFLGRERIDVEYGVGLQTLDHWIYGPHHGWTDPETGIIVRLWQPFNGLQVFPPGTFQQGTDASLFSELSPDGSRSPAMAKPGGSTFRVKCKDDGYSTDSIDNGLSLAQSPRALELATQPVAYRQSTAKDLQRARTKVPRPAYKGDNFSSMSETLNRWLLKHAPNSKECDEWTVKELQSLQVQLFMLRDSQLDEVYQGSGDNRRLRAELAETTKEWDELNSLAESSPELMRIHRDGHCHEAVMWYTHHLPEIVKAELKDRIALPLLSRMSHDLSKLPAANVSLAAKQVHGAYKYKVSCADCHSAVFPE